MKYDFDEIISRKGVNSVKWENMEMMGEGLAADTLPLWVADMDFPCPQPVIDALHERVDKNIFGYSFFKTERYFSAVTGWLKKRFDWNVSSSDIFTSPGVVHALESLIKIFSNVGNGVIIQQPVYYPFAQKIINNGRVLVNNQLINNDGYYTIDFDDLKSKAQDPNNTLMILCSPHNPVGRVWTIDELTKIANICIENDVILVSDEVHFDLIRKDVKHYPIASLINNDSIITCTAPSKTFNLAGMQCSNIIIRNAEQKQKWIENYGNESLMNPLSIVAVQAAYEEGEEWLHQVNKYIDDNLAFIADFVTTHLPKVNYAIPEGTYLAWLDFSAYGYSSEQLEKIIRYEAKVLLDSGDIFGESGTNFQRINAACPRSILQESLERIQTALQ